MYHWLGTVLVFGGTLIFVELASKIREALMPAKETKIDWSMVMAVLCLRWTEEQQEGKDTEKENDEAWQRMWWLRIM